MERTDFSTFDDLDGDAKRCVYEGDEFSGVPLISEYFPDALELRADFDEYALRTLAIGE